MTASVAGKSFWLDRKIRLWTRSQLGTQLAARGGSVRDAIAAGLDYVVLDRSRWAGTAAPEEEARACGAAVLALDEFYALLCPGRDEALAVLRGGPANRERWEALLPLASSPVAVDLAGADLSGLDLAGFLFRRCDLAGANLAGTTLDGATLSGPVGVDFTKVFALRGASVGSAVGCDFDGLDLAGAKLGGRFERCSFRRTNLRQAEAASVEWVDCVATEAVLAEADFSGWKAERLNAPNLQAAGATLSRASFREAHLGGAVFREALLDEAVLAGAHLEQADFTGADLREADLTDADLRRAGFRKANLADADFTGATTTGAAFDGSHRRGAKGLTVTEAAARKKAAPPAPPPYGARLVALAEALAPADNWLLTFVLAHRTQGPVAWSFEPTGRGRFRVTSQTRTETTPTPTGDWARALFDLEATQRDATLQVDTVRLLPQALADELGLLPVQALCELFGVLVPESLPAPRSLYTALADGVEAFLREGEPARQLLRFADERERFALLSLAGANLAGIDLSGMDLGRIDAAGVNLTGANLAEVRLHEATLRDARLDRAVLKKARLEQADCRAATARGADLGEANLKGSDWRAADLRDADLKKANLAQARLEGADLTGADLDGVVVNRTLYDAATVFPEGFQPEGGWISTSGELTAVPADYPALVQLLGYVLQPRWSHVASHVTAGLAPLWAEVDADRAHAVVPAAVGATTFHACRITRAGRFQCATPDLAPCPDAADGVCRHVVCLVLSLVQREHLSAEDAARWLQRSLAHDAGLDRDALGEVFARYAETIQADYRPNETLPEDYYAL